MTTRPPRFVTAASLYDGHDASINIMRRVLMDCGVEVIHLGHNRSAEDIVDAAIQEDADAIAISSYQGGHNEFFRFMHDLLREKGAPWIRIFGGGGGVIVPQEIDALHEYGIDRIYSPEDGRKLGLEGMIKDMLSRVATLNGVHQLRDTQARLPQWITAVENTNESSVANAESSKADPPVIGLTGTGGAGKSSLTDEILRRFLGDFTECRVGVLSVDPTKKKTGGALLGDRIRMNAVHHPRAFMRSLATRRSGSEVPETIRGAIDLLKRDGFDLILLETSGIGQGDSEISDLADVSVYVMTSDYGASTQLEKIDMIDFADIIVLNKFDKRGSDDALRDVRKQYRRSRKMFDPTTSDDELPIFGTVASNFGDPGVERFYQSLLDRLAAKYPDGGWAFDSDHFAHRVRDRRLVIPPERTNYLLDVVKAIRDYKSAVDREVKRVREAEALEMSADVVGDEALSKSLRDQAAARWESVSIESKRLLEEWPARAEAMRQPEFMYSIRGKERRESLQWESLAGLNIPRIALPRYESKADLLRFLKLENLPGAFPYTGGVFPFRRRDEEPKRMFAGEGPPEQTNERFHYLCQNEPTKRLSTAFDSVTLYGEDPHERPDIFGKVGESGVSICTLDDMKRLYQGFDLCDAKTSVSMTINGPAPIILAMYFNAAIDQQVDQFNEQKGRQPNPDEWQKIHDDTLRIIRGTVQADILKEDQAQNTCIFSTEFALRMMGDIQQYFIEREVRNYYSVSISGYHIAEAGANPVTQLAFTLSNGFTYVEYYLARGMEIDAFAPNLSFFFSNGLDPEYSVLGRVARRIWAVAMREHYGASDRSQKLKYHIQTSGRSLHAMEIDFNDIRTTLQALMAYYDNCNSLHTNAYDEAITTPTEESVRRAMAIQLIIARELGLSKNDNGLQGGFIYDELTELVEEAVLEEFMRLNDRGGVIGAMERQYQRSKIQSESHFYEYKKHTGELPIIGVNSFLREDAGDEFSEREIELIRSTPEIKNRRIAQLKAFQSKHADDGPPALARLQEVAISGGNIFQELMKTVRVASLGQITHALYEVGGQYRRNM